MFPDRKKPEYLHKSYQMLIKMIYASFEEGIGHSPETSHYLYAQPSSNYLAINWGLYCHRAATHF